MMATSASRRRRAGSVDAVTGAVAMARSDEVYTRSPMLKHGAWFFFAVVGLGACGGGKAGTGGAGTGGALAGAGGDSSAGGAAGAGNAGGAGTGGQPDGGSAPSNRPNII